MFFSIQIFTAYELISPGKLPLDVHIPSPDIPIQQKNENKTAKLKVVYYIIY